MSIIEQIKNGARFRHKDGTPPKEWAILGVHIVVLWADRNCPDCYRVRDINDLIELIPEEETLWVVIPKKNHGKLTSEQDAIMQGDFIYGPGNYTIHSITRKK